MISLEMWTIWLIAAVIFAIIEIYTPSFFIIWFSGGSLAACLASLIFPNVLVQLGFFIAVSFILVISTAKITKRFNEKNAMANSEVLVDKIGIVTQKISLNDAGRIKVCDQSWKATTDDTEVYEEGQKVKVVSLNGVTLKVTKIN